MDWSKMLQPTRQKIIGSLIPFLFSIVQIFSELDLAYNLIPLQVNILLEIPLTAIALTESFFARPFEPVLSSLGWWSRDSIFVGPDGPLLPGSIAVAIIYSLLIYTTWSLLSAWKSNRQQTV